MRTKSLAINMAVAGSFALVLAGFSPPRGATPTYAGNFRELPLTDIEPQGWLKEILLRQRNGLGINHAESGYPYNTSLWAGQIPKGGNPQGQGWWPYEQAGYLVDGLYRCGLALGDTALQNIGRRSIDFVLNNPRPDGQLGLPVIGRTQWPFSVFVRAMMADYDATRNPKILDALTKHFLALHRDNWDDREVCIIESMCWTYGRTGDARLIEFAEHIWNDFVTNNRKSSTVYRPENAAKADSVYGHGVSVSEIGKQPAVLYLYTGKAEYKKAAEGFFNAVARDHGLVDGIPSSSESLAGKKTTAQHETCDVSDYTWSLGYLLQATGDVSWADKIERGIFNGGLGSISKDFRSHEYFSAPNQVYATQSSSGAGRQRVAWRSRAAYRPGFDTECCSGNVHRFLPNFAARLWMSDAKNGIVATLYAPNILSTKVNGDALVIREQTNYPFEGTIEFRVDKAPAKNISLSLRIPAWAEGGMVKVNGEPAKAASAGTFFTLTRLFKPGDKVTLDLPMKPRQENPVAGGVSIVRGPLLFALHLPEKATKITNQDKSSVNFPAWDLEPASAWNYSLDAKAVTNAKVIVKRSAGFPWDEGNWPVTIRLTGRAVADWTFSETMPDLPKPGFTTGAPKVLTLVPEGATRIRLSVFPEAATR